MKYLLFLVGVIFLGLSATSQSAETAKALSVVRELSDSVAVEYAPSVSADGKTLIFESNRTGSYKLFESVKNEQGKWSVPEALTPINSFGDSTDLIGGPSLSFDGNTLYFFASIGIGSNSDLYYSTRTENGWASPQSMGNVINSAGYEAFPSISADGKTLYFVRNNESGPSDKDMRKQDLFCTSIFKSSKKEDGTWSTPIKLPRPINVDCEKAPKIMADGKTLIFSSNRPGGKGDYDMYQSKLNILGEWIGAIPLDYVNTDKSDQLPSISASGDLMYFVYNNQDISTVEIPKELRQFMNNVITGTVKDRDTEEGIAATILVTDAFTSREIMKLNTNPENGAFSVVVPVGFSYNLQVLKDGYSTFAKYFDLRKVNRYQETKEEISLFKTIQLQLTVSDKELFNPLEAEVEVTTQNGTQVNTGKTSPKSGILILDLPIGSGYTIKIGKENYLSEEITYDVTGLVMYQNFRHEVDLSPKKVEVQINVSDLVNNSKVKSKVRLINRDRDEVIEVEGNQLVSLRAGDRYEVEATSDQGYAFNSTSINPKAGEQEQVSLKLQKLERNALLTLRDILFESNSSQLDEVSYQELRRVIKLMMENPSLKVEIAAHTDDIGSASYNQVLSEKRAESVVQFMVENQVALSRFIAKGYGESDPKIGNDTEENRTVNRRVELKILEM